MSYGPQLPPHLQRRSEESSDEDDGQTYGPRLPSQPCRGPDPGPRAIGPTLPPPPSSRDLGPTREESEDEDDDEIIGPMPPKPGEEISANEAAVKSFEERARKMRDQIEGRDGIEEPKRESWMLELPAEKAKNFGLGPRQFSRSSNPKAKQDRSWTETPADKARRAAALAAGENPESEAAAGSRDSSQDADVLAYMASLKRDEEMEAMSSQLKAKRGSESLMERHAKKVKSQKKAADGQPKERRPFDREVDLQASRFDEAQKKAMLKKAANLDNRFSKGSSKYL